MEPRSGLVLAFLALLSACGAPPEAPVAPSVPPAPDQRSPTSTEPPAPDGSSSALAQKGEACGDDVAVQRKCAPGLKCVMSDTAPVSEHTPGTCR